MSYQLQIGRREWTASGETLTITAVAPNGVLYDYFPSSPIVDVVNTAGETVGSWPVSHRVRNATETLKINFATDGVDAAIRTLNESFAVARLWAESARRDLEMVLRFRDSARHGAEEWYEARLFGGSLKLERGHDLTVTWERAPYWEGAEEIVQVQTRSMVAMDDYAQIVNCEDSNPANSNVLRLDTPDGDVPTPIRVRINNDYASDRRLASVRMHWFSEIVSPTLEPGNCSPLPDFSPSDDASDGSYGVGTSFAWEVQHSLTRNYTGWFRLLVNGSLFGDWTARMGYVMPRSGDQQSTVTGSHGWTDFGLFYLPPRGYTSPVRYPFNVWLSGDTSSRVDFVLLLPVMDQTAQWRNLTFDGFNAIEGTCIEDDMRRMDEPAIYEISGQKWPIVNAVGGPIEIWPAGLPGSGNQCLVFALENDEGGAEALRTAQVQVYAHPRYSNLP